MTCIEKLKDTWTLLTIDDPDFLSGKSISDIIKLISKLVNVKFIVITNLSMGGYDQNVGGAEEIKPVDKLCLDVDDKITEANHSSFNNMYSLQEFMEAYEFLEENQNEILEIKKVIPFVTKIGQFDWGDFFLFKDYPSKWEDDQQEYPHLVSLTDITIRAIDDQYIDVYSPNTEIVELIRQNYVIENISTGLLTDFIYPS